MENKYIKGMTVISFFREIKCKQKILKNTIYLISSKFGPNFEKNTNHNSHFLHLLSKNESNTFNLLYILL